MDSAQQKIVQYLNEARATELALVRVLQSQIAMTPRGSYRTALERHLDETRSHAQQVGDRLKTLERNSNPVTAIIGFWEDAFGQAVAFSKTPWDLVRGSGGEEKVLKNAKDACASEALEIATYTAIARLARSVGDDETAELAQGILAEEERMLERVMREIPKLVDAVVGAEVKDNPSYDITTTGAAETVREAGAATRTAAEETTKATKRGARTARKVPGVAQTEGQIKGAVAGEADLAIARYDTLTADEIISKLSGVSQIDLAKIDSYERRNQNRTTVLSRVTALRGDEPWPGYDELTVAEVQSVLSDADEDRLKQVRDYERSHKNRAGVLNAAEREITHAS
jgi:ferritin-like metal-binding protein YciE